MNISALAVKRPITTLMIVLSALVIGGISLSRIPLVYLPEISGNSLRVQVPYKSSSPQEIEDLITLHVEDAFRTVKNVETIESTSTDVSSDITLQFKIGTDMDLATMEVRDKLEQAKNKLPDDIERIRIFRFKSGDLPVVEFSVSIRGEAHELYTIIENVIKPRIQRIKGVANVDVGGIEQKQISIDLDLKSLKSLKIDTFALRTMLRENNVNVSAGDVSEGETKYIVRAIGEFQNIDEIKNLPISEKGIRLSDVADISYDFPQKKSYQRLNGRDAVKVKVMKSSEANMVSVAKDVIGSLNKLRTESEMQKLDIYVYRDRSQPIIERIESLRNAGLLGGVLVIFVLFFFLRNMRSALVITAAIPISILCTFCFIFLLRKFVGSEITLNVISVSGLMLALGMIVDPAVVVLENIFRHRQENNLDLKDAAMIGGNEVGVAIIAATATTICVFIPLIFLSQSRMGAFMHDFGLSICTALVASLFVSLTLIPLAASRFLKVPESDISKGDSKTPDRGQKPILRESLLNLYTKLIKLTLRFRWITAGVATLIIVFAYYLYGQLETEFSTGSINREIHFKVVAPESYSIDDTRILFEKLEGILRTKQEELEIETLSSYFKRSGGTLAIYFVGQDEAKRPVTVLSREIKPLFPVIPGVQYRRTFRHSNGGRDVNIEIKGRNSNTLLRLAEDVKRRLETIPDLEDVNTNLEKGKDEILVTIDQDKARMSAITSQRIAFGIAGALGSRAVSKFEIADKEVDINLQLKEEDRQHLDQLKNLEFENVEQEGVALNRVVDFKRRRGPQAIERKDRKPIVVISASHKGRGLEKVKSMIMAKMENVRLPAGYEWNLGEEFSQFESEKSETKFGLILAILLIYMIMASLFESFVHPLTIVLTIPFAFTGVALVFFLTDVPLDSLARLGLLLLSGLVVNNAIILIDSINRLRRSGMDRYSAIVKGGRDRLRPILMTSFTTILGLLPMILPIFVPTLFGPFEGRDKIWAPVGLVVVSGLISATFLTLVIMPTIYSLIDDAGMWIKKLITIE
ncbi:MAG: efflux RND transporter permease subunit [Candidatus Scalindua sp. AMX11]|nr:MAG: AcrB/AcrD/AcrF family protein [Candidatus Scalindua sp.]NOG85428.1 efflux RND transporter permease subunit [Planctomycetota bacterium]RZV84021.1 MAG: efflux RND transporter permease subunit [Candidatus Scalindua sp. SCAELEC01]TDE65695.1 MAG: efflux RND transporter permease subunit [Candidatus Scalindua sp. AMX11]GJQ58819.1 MAG: multidrug ABC transporter [Candidatus Scalindua sp.]